MNVYDFSDSSNSQGGKNDPWYYLYDYSADYCIHGAINLLLSLGYIKQRKNLHKWRGPWRFFLVEVVRVSFVLRLVVIASERLRQFHFDRRVNPAAGSIADRDGVAGFQTLAVELDGFGPADGRLQDDVEGGQFAAGWAGSGAASEAGRWEFTGADADHGCRPFAPLAEGEVEFEEAKDRVADAAPRDGGKSTGF